MSRSYHHALAFTRIEMVVALSALVVIWALLMPTIHDGRGEARRAACAVNLGQVAQAVQSFEQITHRYPGYLEAFGRDTEGYHKISTWVVPLLPHLEQDSLYHLWSSPEETGHWTRRGGGHSQINAALYPKLSVLLCPSDENLREPLAPLSYAVNCGFYPDTLPATYQLMSPDEQVLRATSPSNGVFSNQLPSPLQCLLTQGQSTRILGSATARPTRSEHIADGTSQTICAAENLQADSWGYVGPPAGWQRTEVDGLEVAGDDLTADSVRVHVGLVWLYQSQATKPGVPEYRDVPVPKGWHSKKRYQPNWARPSSNHSSLANVAMLSGSVQSLSNGVDYGVYQSLLAPDDSRSDVPWPAVPDKSLQQP